jgi:hypothetical protein
MNKYLDEYLCKKYPKIFQDRNAPMAETCMCWGFPGNGWFFLLDTLCEGIQHHIDNPPYVYKKSVKFGFKRLWNGMVIKFRLPYKWTYGELMEPSVIPQVIALQVKEKFSSLRFYYSGGDKKIRGMVTLAEHMSAHICEICGKMNEEIGRNTKGWSVTTCKGHSNGARDFKFNYDAAEITTWENVREEIAGKPAS